MKKIKVAITGWNGFLGTYLIKALKEKSLDIVYFDSKKHDLFNPKTLKSFLEDADIVIHLAGANRDTEQNLFKVNILGTIGLLEGILRYSPQAKIIFSSSFQIYGESSYGLSKKLAEDAIRSFSRIYGIKSIIFRISNIYGKGGKPFYNSVIATFIHQIKTNNPLLINGDGKQKRDYIYVEDVAKAIIKAIDYHPLKPFECFDICSGKLSSLKEIISILQENTPKRIKINYNLQNKDKEKSIKKPFGKTMMSLSWRPTVSLREGLRKTLN